MSFYRNVLKRAEREGKIDPDLLRWEKRSVTGAVDGKGKGPGRPRPWIDPFDLPDEALNDLQRVIENLCSMASERKLRVIGLAGAVPDQGNSTLAALFSLMMARRENGHADSGPAARIVDLRLDTPRESEGHRVLLIDVNTKRPTLHRIFRMANEAGLCELLNGEFTARDVAREVEPSNLRLITAGGNDGFRFAKIHFNRLRSILEKSRNQDEFVFLDLPAILQQAEGITLSKLCDGVILIVCAERTSIEVVQEAKRLLEDVDVPLVGSVLNRRKHYIPEWVYKRL